MNKECNDLVKKFKMISKMKCIKGVNNLTNSVGLTFESLLDKKVDSLYFPDYKGIEIKCTQRFSRYPITLFTSTFDGPEMYEMNTILQKYGKNDSFYRDKKTLKNDLYFRYYRIIIYKLISFEKFIELLKNDIIIVSIVGRVS